TRGPFTGMGRMDRPPLRPLRPAAHRRDGARRGHVNGAGTRVLDVIAYRLGSRRTPFLSVLAGVVFALPALANGLLLDDWVHREKALGPDWARLDLFDFWSGRPDDTHALIDRGFLPWFTYERLRIGFFRPLASVTHVFDYRVLRDPV